MAGARPVPRPVELTPAQAERAGRRPRDVLLSLAALLLPLLVLLGAYRLVWNGDHPIAVDVSETYATARHAGAFPVLEPQPVPDGWTTNAASYTPPVSAGAGAVLRVVYHAPGGAGAQLVQSSGAPDAVLAAELGQAARPGNLLTIAGQPWREYPQLPRGSRALVNVADGRTVVITGDATADQLRQLASSLR